MSVCVGGGGTVREGVLLLSNGVRSTGMHRKYLSEVYQQNTNITVEWGRDGIK